jgi:hypothetical protein
MCGCSGNHAISYRKSSRKLRPSRPFSLTSDVTKNLRSAKNLRKTRQKTLKKPQKTLKKLSKNSEKL